MGQILDNLVSVSEQKDKCIVVTEHASLEIYNYVKFFILLKSIGMLDKNKDMHLCIMQFNLEVYN